MKTNTLQYKIYFILVFAFLFASKGNAQDGNFWSNVRFGGNLGIGVTNETFNIVVAPAALYQFNPWYSAGLGLHFGYTDAQDFTATNYGASIISLFDPIPELQLSAEFEQMGVSQTLELDGGNRKDDYWYPALFVGAGFRTGPVSVGIRYDLLYDDDKSIYASAYAPFVRVFF